MLSRRALRQVSYILGTCVKLSPWLVDLVLGPLCIWWGAYDIVGWSPIYRVWALEEG